MVASVLGREQRAGEDWIYLDVGAYHGLIETHRRWVTALPVVDLAPRPRVAAQVPFTVTGPTCDSADTMFHGAPLPSTMAEGDLVFIAPRAPTP